ncbi:MAG: hypothetical protein A3F46_04140 [Legionellales bacterium RIFCSPHIGHO2_12_FULL_42_9]|nr:MAG: hypothetical protein A3F46_04140 [Legionellales bacterium RIFCSPHIGHO2_12_FULL_42_9]
MKKVGFLMVGVACLMGCSSHYLSNDKQQYSSSRNGPLLEVPSSLTSSNMSAFYDLPTPKGDVKVSVFPPQI